VIPALLFIAGGILCIGMPWLGVPVCFAGYWLYDRIPRYDTDALVFSIGLVSVVILVALG